MRPVDKVLRKSLTINRVGSPSVLFDEDYTGPLMSSYGGEREQLTADFEDYVSQAYQSNGIVFACILARQMPFSEVRFQYQRVVNGRPGDLFGTQKLSLLENPWPNGTTGELLSRMEQDASLAGNFYATVVDGFLRRLRPDWVTIVSGVKGAPSLTAYNLGAQIHGYIYGPPNEERTLLLPEQVAHFSPIPDPLAQWRGMSWLTPILREISSDTAATRHKQQFFRNGAMSNMVVTHDPQLTREQFMTSVELFDSAHRGGDNAYKTLHFGGGMDAKILGADLRQVDFKAIQGAGESRIAAAAGVGSIIARLSEGMQGSSLNAGNYQAAKRQFADMTLRPLWRTAAGALAKFVSVPPNARLWYDARDVAFLAEDQTARADILTKEATTVRTLTDAGFDPDSVIAAVTAGDLSLLKGAHSGMYSVQLAAPGSAQLAPPPSPSQGGTP